MQESFSDSDDEEILFTKEMVRRLKKSAQQKIPANSRPTSSLSDTSGVSTMSVASVQKVSTEISGLKNDDTVDTGTIEKPSESCIPVKETLNSETLLLTPRTRARVLREIWESCDTSTTGKAFRTKPNNATKKHYFRRKLSEFNNTIRILEVKQEEALWNEEYKLAAEIEKCLKKLRSRQTPLEELLLERVLAVENRDYSEA